MIDNNDNIFRTYFGKGIWENISHDTMKAKCGFRIALSEVIRNHPYEELHKIN
jgi:hypothetical protein